MRVELLVLPFVCTAALAVLAPFLHVGGDVATLFFVFWLVTCNLIHGVNAVLWTGSIDEHVPVWCDIVTKLVLGAMMALPASCLCIMRRLEHVASARPLSSDPKVHRNRFLFEISLCLAAPVLFMAFHLVFQNHRFDILRDYGCSASAYPSALSAIMWLPPLLCCITTFILAGTVIHHSNRSSVAHFSQHVLSRFSVESSQFFRRLTVTFLLNTLLFVLILFSLFSGSSNARISWSLIHADFSVIHVVKSSDNPGIAILWWGLRILSFVYILLSVTLGDARDAAKRMRSRRSSDSSTKTWPLHTLTPSAPSMPANPPTIPTPRVISLDLKSGWDDMWDRKRTPLHNFLSSGSSKAKPQASSSRAPSRVALRNASSPNPTPSPTMTDDEAFLESTLTYLGTPAAHSLGLNVPILPPAPIHSAPRKARSKPSPIKQLPTPAAPESRRLSGVSAISSMFEAHWPQPPESPSPTASRTPSPYSPGASSAHAKADSVSTISHNSPPGVAGTDGFSVPTALKRTSLRAVKGQWNQKWLSAPQDVIYESSRPQAI